MVEDSNNGIVKRNMGNEEYIFWTHADFIKPYIIHYLKERFPGKLVIRELNKIDLVIPEENLPIEVQATAVQNASNSPVYSLFEKSIEKQINQNITSYHVCWLFFDSELLRAMTNADRHMSINMVWFRNYMKEGKLKVFTVSHDGIIEEKQYSDFDFLSKVSQTCSIAAKSDDMILNENKIKIFSNIVNGYEFVQDEIDRFYDDYREYCKTNKIDSEDKNDSFSRFLRKQKDDRTKLYGDILNAVSNLFSTNDLLELKNYRTHAKFNASSIGIFDVEGASNKNATTRFIDRFNICQYFPGYMRNKEMWDKLKNHSLNPRQFERIIKNGIGNYFYYEENKGDIVTESDKIDDKGINVTIESKDQIISVNIKDKTKQANIEDSWN